MADGWLADFLTRALVAGAAVALVAGPLGCLVIWRRMAFFGATLAHSALLGIALGFLLDINLTLGLVVGGGLIALTLAMAEGRPGLANDTLLSIVGHGALAAGLIALAFVHGVRVDLMGYLFGDILAVGVNDVYLTLGLGVLTLAATAALWRPLLRVAVHAEMAAVEGVPVTLVRVGFMVLLAVVVAVALKVVGILLVTSLLVMPAAAARPFARTPEMMAALAALGGVIAVAGGIAGSYAWDVPAGAAIVCAAAALFVLSLLVPVRR